MGVADARSIGARVRKIRSRHGLSLDVAAGLAGITKGYLSMLELGQRGFNRRGLLEDLAAAPTSRTGTATPLPLPITLTRPSGSPCSPVSATGCGSTSDPGGQRQRGYRHLDIADRITPTRIRNDPIARDLVLTPDRRTPRRVWELDSLRNRFGVGGQDPRSVDN